MLIYKREPAPHCARRVRAALQRASSTSEPRPAPRLRSEGRDRRRRGRTAQTVPRRRHQRIPPRSPDYSEGSAAHAPESGMAPCRPRPCCLRVRGRGCPSAWWCGGGSPRPPRSAEFPSASLARRGLGRRRARQGIESGHSLAGRRRSPWCFRQARNLMLDLGERAGLFRFLIRDRDTRFTASFDEVFTAQGVRIIRTPARASQAHAFAEWWIRSARRECLDRALIHGERHLLAMLGEYVVHYNEHRPHQARRQLPPAVHARTPPITDLATARVRRRTILNGLISEYAQAG